MADITKCTGKKCKAKLKCYRFKAETDKYRQSWFVNTPGKDNKCEYFIQMEKIKK